MKFGIYRLHEPLEESTLSSIEETYGTAIQIVSVYRAWNKCSAEDDRQWLERLKSTSRHVMLTWEPWMLPASLDRPYDQPDFALKEIISGRYDDYIGSFAGELAKFPRTVLLRMMHEMNGNWYPWCGTVNGNSPDDYIAAWNHIRNIVTSEASSNVKWVWSPYASSHPVVPHNRIEDYFPGDNVMDWVAIDGYNWGNSREWSEWQSFEKIFSAPYKTVTDISQCPVMIGETACAENGGNKSHWITDAFDVLAKKFPRIEAIVWFDSDKECDWRIFSSADSLNAFRAAVRLLNPH